MRSGHAARSSLLGIGLVLLAACGQEDETYPQTQRLATAERSWTDTTRRTPANGGSFAGEPRRTLRTRIWLPEAGERLPLLLMAHGFGGLPEKFEAFARHVAGAGYIVAAPAFPLTHEGAPGGHENGLRDYVRQPGDVSFVLGKLLEAAGTAGDALAGRIDPERIAVLGHSLGGVTTLGLTRMDCCRDTRVKATVLVAAVSALAIGFGPDPITTGPPTLILQGTEDRTVAYATATELYQAIEPPRFLVGLRNTGHSEALEDQSEPPIPSRKAAQEATVGFLEGVFRGREAQWRATRGDLAARGEIILADPQ